MVRSGISFSFPDAVGLACGDQRRLTGNGSALEALGDDALYKSMYFFYKQSPVMNFSLVAYHYLCSIAIGGLFHFSLLFFW